MNVEGQYNPKDVECISVENLEVLPSGADWQSRHLESERRKAEIRDRIHKQAEQGQKTAKDYFRPAKPTPSIYDRRPEDGFDYLCQHFTFCPEFFGLHDTDRSFENYASCTSHRCVL